MAKEPAGKGLKTRAEDGAQKVERFALGSESLRPGARLSGLDRLAERLARRLRDVLEPFAKAKPKVEHAPALTSRFDTWRDGLPEFTSVSLYRMRPMKGGMLIALAPDYVSRLVDAFYGGTGAPPKGAVRKREFTAAEERLLGRVTEGIVLAVVETWADIVNFEPQLAARETNAGYATLVRGDEPVVVQRFSVAGGGPGATTIDLVFPLAAMRAYESQLSAKVHAEAGAGDSEFRYRLARALENVSLPVRSVVARPTLSVKELLSLKVGDVIPITLAPKVPLIVGNRRLAEGTIGEQEGRAAFQIETLGALDRPGGHRI
ncbi:flagellar motor switch protein FliM [Sphingomonas morindae]|uniref:Flagellar motor switch protein FliM n=1 Tax=Sphingomonas morindae TaxID=1541170 RepID=A0ABY4X9V6_9SPHN|nr:FliM/FliN family flagellar motor switch protein [Sphingomonas morindae]USI73717.1 flagellar motor switch protein FliM [Sphingomonas morindae]